MSDPVVRIKLQYYSDNESARQAAQQGANAAQSALGGSGAGIGGAGVAAAAGAMSGGIPGTAASTYAAGRALAANPEYGGDVFREREYVRGQRADQIADLRRVIARRNALSANRDAIPAEEFAPAFEGLQSQINRGRATLNRYDADEDRLGARSYRTEAGARIQNGRMEESYRRDQLRLGSRAAARRAGVSAYQEEDIGSAYGTNPLGFGIGSAGRDVDRSIESTSSREATRMDRSAQRVGDAVERIFTAAASAAAKQEQRVVSQRSQRVERNFDLAALAGQRIEERQTAALPRANFDADVANMNPNQAYNALMGAAEGEVDPLQSARYRRQAGRYRQKSGMHRQVMSTGMFMNALFGGMESFHAINTFAQAGEGATPEDLLSGYLTSAQTIKGGFLGSFAGMAADTFNTDEQYARGTLRYVQGMDKSRAMRGNFSDMMRGLGGQRELAISGGYRREITNAAIERRESERDIREAADAYVNQVRDAQKERRKQADDQYENERGEEKGSAFREGRPENYTEIEKRHTSAMRAMDEELAKARRSVDGKGMGEVSDIYFARIKEIENRRFSETGSQKIATSYNLSIAGIPMGLSDIEQYRATQAAERQVLVKQRNVAMSVALPGMFNAAESSGNAAISAHDSQTAAGVRSRNQQEIYRRAGLSSDTEYDTAIGDIPGAASPRHRELLTRNATRDRLEKQMQADIASSDDPGEKELRRRRWVSRLSAFNSGNGADDEAYRIESTRRSTALASSLAEDVAGIIGEGGVNRAILERNPGAAARIGLKNRQDARRRGNPVLSALGLLDGVDASEMGVLNQGIGDSAFLRGMGLDNRQTVASILAGPGSNGLRGVRADIAGISGGATYEAESLARAGYAGDAQKALKLGLTNLDAFKQNYFGGFQVQDIASKNSVNLNGGTNTVDVQKIQDDLDKAREALEKMQSDIASIAARGSTGGGTALTSP